CSQCSLPRSAEHFLSAAGRPAGPTPFPTRRSSDLPAATRVPGIRVCEHLPRLGRVMDRLCLLRSMTHRMNVHGPACSEVFSGREDRKSTRLNSSHVAISYAVFCLKKKTLSLRSFSG